MIVVTTPTGAIGSQVLAGLLNAGERVRVVVRNPERLAARTRDSVEVVEGSHGDPGVVDHAFAGARAVFWLPPPNARAASLDEVYADFARPACAAFARHGVRQVVGISALGRGTPLASRAGLVSASLAMDDLIGASGVRYRALTMPSFMDNMLSQADSIRNHSEFFWPGPSDLKAPTCAVRDIADVAVRLLRDPAWDGRDEQAVLGPEDLSPEDLARIMSEVLGRSVALRIVTAEDFRTSLGRSGMSAAFVEGYVDMMSAKAEGLDNFVTRTPDNTTPTTFRRWCEEVLKPVIGGGSGASLAGR